MPQNWALPTYSTIYAFGDSLSDAGNLSLVTSALGATRPVSPPYFQQLYGAGPGNVFSNGPTWLQDVSVALGLGILSPSLLGGTNYAFGGAQTGPTSQNADEPEIRALSLPAQILQFQATVPAPSANALYTLSIGSNDLIDILGDVTLTPEQQAADVNAAVVNAIAGIRQLVAGGAKHLLVLGVPDLGKTPIVTQGLVNGSNTPSAALSAEASQLSRAYNAGLSSRLASIVGPNLLDLNIIDAYSLIDDAVADPTGFGFTNVTSPVWSGNNTDASSGSLVTTVPAEQNQYLFWDHLHPTAAGHLAIATVAEHELAGATFIDDSEGAQVGRLYKAAFGRAPDDAGLDYWSGVLHAGGSLVDVAGGLLTSAEFPAQATSSDGAYVTGLYRNAFHRNPDADGLAYWSDALERGAATRAEILVAFAESSESKAKTPPSTDAQEAARLYWATLERAPDSDGLTFWTSALSNGMATLPQEADALVASQEFVSRFGNLDDAGFVGRLYENALGRTADPDGLAAWTGLLTAGATRGSVVTGFSESSEGLARLAAVAGHDGILVS